jgi:phage tail protein X
MPIITFRGEKTVGEIADKMFVRLTPRQKEMAEAAILKANPRLAEPAKLNTGTILKVPDLAELRPKTSRALESPDALLAKHLADALDGFRQRFEGRSKQAQEDSAQQIALLKSAALKRALGETPALRELAANVSKLQDARGKELASRQKSVDTALQAMRKELGQ